MIGRVLIHQVTVRVLVFCLRRFPFTSIISIYFPVHFVSKVEACVAISDNHAHRFVDIAEYNRQ